MSKRRKRRHWKQAIAGLKAAVNGDPVRVSVVRRMKVKGETVYARETYTTSLKPKE